MLDIAGEFVDSGMRLTQEEAFLLACSIAIHDLGMVIPLKEFESVDIFGGIPQPTEPTSIENRIRDLHHELLDQYLSKHTDFLAGIGLTLPEMSIIREISRGHRKIDLNAQPGHCRSIGALIRVIDELDLHANRAPQIIVREHYEEFDATSCWHWFKHNIVAAWSEGHTVKTTHNTGKTFTLAVHPSQEQAIPYWLNQVRRPIHKALYDENCARIINEVWRYDITVVPSQDLSSAGPLDIIWKNIENKAMSAGRKVIMVADDEVRKMEDLFIPLMDKYHIIFAPNAKDALDKLAASKIDLAIIDLQMGSGHMWNAIDTGDFKRTGWILCKTIKEKYPETRIGILSGSRHAIEDQAARVETSFNLKKPVDPEEFERAVRHVLE